MILHLGVVDIPYVGAPTGGRRKRAGSTITTGDVAEILEDRYHVMEHYVQAHMPDIAKSLEKSLAGAIESTLMGAPAGRNIYGTAEGEIDEGFRRFIENKEMDGMGYPGIPTQASLDGVNKRMKIKRGPVRPSFRDSGLYMGSFKSWVE